MPAPHYPLVEYIRVAAVDTDETFKSEVSLACKRLGIRNFYCAESFICATEVVFSVQADILFLEAERKYSPIWERIRLTPQLRSVIIGATQGRNARTWLDASRAGAERIISKQQAAALVEPMLVHLIEGDAARRFRVVPFPSPGADRC